MSRATTASTGTTRPYLGLGPSAHSFAPADTDGRPPRRWWNERRTVGWEGRVAAGDRPVEATESLGPQELATETLMLGLRTTTGVDLDDFAARYGVDLSAANEALVARLLGERRLVLRADADGRRWLVPTLSGWRRRTASPPRSTSRPRADATG